jgi:hypothetical protein
VSAISFRVAPARGGRWDSAIRWLRGVQPLHGTWWAPRDGGVVVEVLSPLWMPGDGVWFRSAPALWERGRPWIWQPSQQMPTRAFLASFDPWAGLVPAGLPAGIAAGWDVGTNV